MANLTGSLKQILEIPGNVGSALVDVETGLSVAQIGDKNLNLAAKAESYAKYMRVKEKLVNDISLGDTIEEIIFTSQLQYHLLYPVKVRILKVRKPENLFFFVALTKSDTNLAQARSKIRQVVAEFAL
jgi:hypothetical protein